MTKREGVFNRADLVPVGIEAPICGECGTYMAPVNAAGRRWPRSFRCPKCRLEVPAPPPPA